MMHRKKNKKYFSFAEVAIFCVIAPAITFFGFMAIKSISTYSHIAENLELKIKEQNDFSYLSETLSNYTLCEKTEDNSYVFRGYKSFSPPFAKYEIRGAYLYIDKGVLILEETIEIKKGICVSKKELSKDVESINISVFFEDSNKWEEPRGLKSNSIIYILEITCIKNDQSRVVKYSDVYLGSLEPAACSIYKK